MDIRKLQRVIVDGLEDVKGQNIVVFNTEHLSSLFERVIIASGTSNRQTKSLASSVREAVKTAGYPVPRLEGESNGEWIIVDCGAAVVHLMQPTIRDYYHLEEIWGDKPVNMKLAASTTRLVKAEEPEEVPAKKSKAGAKKAPVEKPAAKKVAAKKVAAKTAAKPAAKKAVAAKTPVSRAVGSKTAPAKKVAAKKTAMPPGRVVTRVVGTKSPGAQKIADKKAVAKKVATRSVSPARSAPAKRPPGRKK
jgi:ribosome-associated protein